MTRIWRHSVALQVTNDFRSCFKDRLHSIISRRAMSDSWRQILLQSAAEEADAGSHASHCWQPCVALLATCLCSSKTVHLCTAVVKQSSSLWRKHCIFSLQISGRQTVQTSTRLTTKFGDWYRNVCTRPCSATPMTWSSASLTHGQAYHETSSTKQLVNGDSGYVHAWRRKDITLNISQTKTGSFSVPPTVYSLPSRRKHVMFHVILLQRCISSSSSLWSIVCLTYKLQPR